MIGRRASGSAPSVPDGVRIYAVGDIHGEAALLDRLHAKIEADLDAAPVIDARLVYLGDYVDRGPDTPGVLDRLAAGALRGLPRVLLKGNHEQMMTAFLSGGDGAADWRRYGGNETLLSYRVDVGGLLGRGGVAQLAVALGEAMPRAHVDLLASLVPAHAIGDYFFCHAGIRPGVPLSQQTEQDLLWIRGSFVDAPGPFEKVIVHGHTPIEDVRLDGDRINIDTGAYATGRLTCLILEGSRRRLLST